MSIVGHYGFYEAAVETRCCDPCGDHPVLTGGDLREMRLGSYLRCVPIHSEAPRIGISLPIHIAPSEVLTEGLPA